ncbi:MAG: adenine methylase [Acidobacteriota bacterium]|jgi:DNA adenine methylase|nr:adenine methylase [Acidobacteriota bacterium]
MPQATAQNYLFGEQEAHKVVNVASVPQRSPFRYPGGKTWLVPRIRQWIASLPKRPVEFIEPFAGGASVSLSVGFEDLSDRVKMVELDEQVAAVWKVIIDGDNGTWLANKIARFNLTPESLKEVMTSPTNTLRAKAFRTILKNRTHHGGILASGSAPLKFGENGKGILSRWYPVTLRDRIIAISKIRNRFTFIEGDGLDVIRQNAHRPGVVFYIDPPYTVEGQGKKAGKRLYTYFHINHEELFNLTSTIDGDFLMTYDNTIEVRELARQRGLDVEPIAMKNTHHAELTELLIGRNLSWARTTKQ